MSFGESEKTIKERWQGLQYKELQIHSPNEQGISIVK